MDKKISKKFAKREVAVLEAPYELLYQYSHASLRRSRKRSNFSTTTKAKILADTNARTMEAVKRIFLYMQLQTIQHLPTSQANLMLEIRHSRSTLFKMNVNGNMSTGSNFIDLDRAAEEKPVFTLTIAQDNIEELNNYSDNPLLLTLYKQEEVQSADAEEETHTTLHPLAQGHIDLLQFFCKKRFLAPVRTYLYPITLNRSIIPIPTCKITWEIYTLLPLLQMLNFCNIAFITFESIYNVSTELLDMTEHLEAELSFRATYPDEKAEYKKVPLCKFPTFVKEIINEQHTRHKWASMADKSFNTYTSLGVHSYCDLNMGQLFKNLLCTAGVDLDFESLDKNNDYALICNSVHRYVLTDHANHTLENLFAFNEQEIVVDIYDRNKPDEILLQGVMDLSVFLYPKVNACRFAVELIPSSKKTQSNNPPEDGSFDKAKAKKTPFAIINICLLWPITDHTNHITIFTNNDLTRAKVRTCNQTELQPSLKPVRQICDETYKTFDEQIGVLIQHIVKKELTSTEDASKYFCCQLRNLSNKILKLVQYDFNVRYPTKTNLEFTNLMTWVYKELVERTYHILQNCGHNNLEHCYISDLRIQSKIIRFVSIYKTLNELGNHELANILLEKTKKMNPNDTCLGFYLCLYNVETQNFDAAKEYLDAPFRERYYLGEHFCAYIRIYIDYMQTRRQEESFNQAMTNLLDNLKQFTDRHPNDVPTWVLLHSLYRFCGYAPGISFTRWKYEDFSHTSIEEIPARPKSRWNIYNDYKLEFNTKSSKRFHKVMNIFLDLGLYKFAEFVYNNIADECTELEQYFISTTFKILLGELPVNFAPHTFRPRRTGNVDEVQAYHAHVTGHFYFAKGDQHKAMENYARLIDFHNIDEFKSFKLGLFRYAYNMMDLENYHEAIRAFQKSCITTTNKLIASIGLGKAMYKLGQLKKAEEYFAQSTIYGMHIPDVWGFLALVNLKMGNNFKALESWKYARLNSDIDISDEVLQELSKINYHDLFLYVCKPF